MKIKKIILENHPIFGLQKIEFDFTKENWEPYNNILFVWENGSGKSTLLEKIIFQFTNIELIYDWWKDEVRSFVIDLTEDEP